MAFRLLKTPNCLIFFKFHFKLKFLKTKILILTKSVLNVNKTCQTSRVHTKLKTSITPQKKEIQKFFLIPNSTLDEFCSDTTHFSVRCIYPSARIV